MSEPVKATACEWSTSSALMKSYHDTEWGVPVYDDRKLFEYLVLDGFQAGLSWEIILRKREGFREAFRNFEPSAVADMTNEDVERLIGMPSIVRNRAKIQATVENAERFLAIQTEFGRFSEYVWSFVGGRPIHNSWVAMGDIPAQTDESRALSLDLKKRGLRFVGPTIIYAVMQSAGLVNDHVLGCPRRSELIQTGAITEA